MWAEADDEKAIFAAVDQFLQDVAAKRLEEMSLNSRSSRLPMWSRAVPETAIPPAGAMPSILAATLTPSP
jgi:hypothetical protein